MKQNEELIKKFNELFGSVKIDDNADKLTPSVTQSLLSPDLKEKETLMTLEEFYKVFPEAKQ